MADFLESVVKDEKAWLQVSSAALERIRTTCGPPSPVLRPGLQGACTLPASPCVQLRGLRLPAGAHPSIGAGRARPPCRGCARACRFTWAIYAERLLSLARIYSFWKWVSSEVLDRSDAERYLQLFYLLQLRPLLQKASPADPPVQPLGSTPP